MKPYAFLLAYLLLDCWALPARGIFRPSRSKTATWKLPKAPWNRKVEETLLERFKKSVKRTSKAAIERTKVTARAALPAIGAAETTILFADLLQVDPTLILFAANLLIYGMWQQPSTQNFMITHFTRKSWDVGKERSHRILTSGFSHYALGHLFYNMLALILWGLPVSRYMGRRAFCYFYISAIYASCLWNENFYLPKHRPTIRLLFWKVKWPLSFVGASGAVYAILAYHLFLIEEDFGNWFGALLWVGSEFANPDRQPAMLGRGAHLGGIIFGASCFILIDKSRPKGELLASALLLCGLVGFTSFCFFLAAARQDETSGPG